MNTYTTNPDGSFMTEDQIVAHLLSIEHDETITEYLRTDFQSRSSDRTEVFLAVICRGMFLRNIRNAYGLWSPNNPYVELNALPNANNVVDHPLFPDNMSARILAKVIDILRQKRTSFLLSD